MTSDLLTTEEVAQWLRCSPRSVRNYTAKGILRAVRVGGHVRYRATTLEALLETLEAAPESRR
ncbi:MAG: helix-turn-helix domain-containing protein [Coriobacteriia bacterium]